MHIVIRDLVGVNGELPFGMEDQQNKHLPHMHTSPFLHQGSFCSGEPKGGGPMLRFKAAKVLNCRMTKAQFRPNKKILLFPVTL